MSEEDLKMYFSLYTDAWRFFKKCVCLSDSEKDWEAANKECITLIKKHGETELAKKLLIDASLLESWRIVEARSGATVK